MSETSDLQGASAEYNFVGPDYFGFYTRELENFFSQDEDFLPFLPQNSKFVGEFPGFARENSLTKSGHNSEENYNIADSVPLFSDAIGAQLSDFKRERLRSLVCQSLFTFTQEVDEMLDSILRLCQIQSFLRYKKNMSSIPGGAYESDHGHHPQKKYKASPLVDSGRECVDVVVPERETTDGFGIYRPEEKSKAGTEQRSELCLDSNAETDKQNGEVDENMQFLLKSDHTMIEQIRKKYSDEFFAVIGHMEQKLEEFLDIVMSKCRSMTLVEKQQLQKLIRDLPQSNLDRVAEIIQRRRPLDRCSHDEIYVDLEQENKVTLWRLYYYVEAVEHARKLCKAQ